MSKLVGATGPPRPHPRVFARELGLARVPGDQPLPTSSARSQLLGICRGHTSGSTIIEWGGITRLCKTRHLSKVLQTGQKSAERGVKFRPTRRLLYTPRPESDYSPPRVISSGPKCKAPALCG